MGNQLGENRSGERGNVLFLILIAVALFAALSYAVTQSTRSGSGDASGETNLINSAQLAQYPAGVRTSIVRMIIGGTSVEQLAFNEPSEFSDLSDNAHGVFHPQGGGAVFQRAPNELMASGSPGSWIFTADFEVEEIGIDSAASSDGNEITAFLPGVGGNICKKINTELGITVSGNDADGDGIPTAGAVITPPVTGDRMIFPGNAGIPATETVIAGAFVGQPFGCFDQDDGDSDLIGKPPIYYHVLVER